MLGTIPDMSEGRTPTNGPEDKKANDNLQGLTNRKYVVKSETMTHLHFQLIESHYTITWRLHKKGHQSLITTTWNTANIKIIWREKWKIKEKEFYEYFMRHTDKISLETKTIKQRENTETCWDKKKKNNSQK